MNQNNKFDPKSKEGKKAIKIIIAVFIAIAVFSGGTFTLIPLIFIGVIFYIFYKAYKSQKNVDKNGFDFEKSYYKKSDTTASTSISQKIEEEFLKGRNYSQSKVNENKLYFDRKTTEFDKHHAHENMYPTKTVTTTKKVPTTPLTKEEELIKYQKELRQLKKDYNDFKIGIIEFRESETILKTKIKEIKKDILEN